MGNNELGETSKKKNSDMRTNEKPLKKARYLWQVKGKYHLKPESNGTDSSDTKSETKCNNDRSCIEALIASTDNILDFPDPENIDKSISDEIPITLVRNEMREDYYLKKWQARQIAKGFVDNTINRVLESWMVAPFDAADFVENCENGGQVEDEGILMAIQSHGLQSGTKSHPVILQTSPTCTCNRVQTSESRVSVPFHHRLALGEPEDNENDNDDEEGDEERNLNEQNEMKMNDTDFLDAAVAVAIQKKGLTSYNCVDCG